MKPADLPQGTLTREALDRVCVLAGTEEVSLACAKHPLAGLNVRYSAGRVRLLCRNCGLEVTRVKLALASAPPAVLPPDTHTRLEAAARVIDCELVGDQASEHAAFLRAIAALVAADPSRLQDLVDKFEDLAAEQERFAGESKHHERKAQHAVAAEAFRKAAAKARASLTKPAASPAPKGAGR